MLLLTSIQAADAPAYKTSFSAIVKLGTDLQKYLKPKYKSVINSQPVFLETDLMPFVKLVEYPDEKQPLRAVFISVGFIDLMTLVSHAKAIDRVEKGFFEKFVVSLGKESGEKELAALPNISNPKYWTDDLMNEQVSNFNQMVGTVLAITLAHHYLGHYQKYMAKMDDDKGKQTAISSFLTPAEWDEAMKLGAKNALDCGFGVEGVKSLYDAIAKMPQRPAWTAYFIPASVKVDKIKKDLEKIEKKFFAGEE
jgi:hypothetical protein